MQMTSEIPDRYAAYQQAHGDLMALSKDNFVPYTSLMTAYLRAVETKRTDRLINDPFAEALAGEAGQRMATLAWKSLVNQRVDLLALRTRYLDEALVNRKSSIHQVVIFASGMDTRAYRLEALKDCHVLEIDGSSEMMERKQRILAEKQATLVAKQHSCIVMDLSKESWPTELLKHGFQPHIPTFWCMEGLLYYLDKQEITQLLLRLDNLSAPGSAFWADMCGAAQAKALRQTFKYGEDDPLTGVLNCVKWELYVAAALGESGEHFGRTWQPTLSPKMQEPMKWFFVGGSKPETSTTE